MKQPTTMSVNCDLLRHQQIGSLELRNKPRSLLIFPTGKGKTITSLHASSFFRGSTIIVLLPKNAVTSWTGDLLTHTSIPFSLYRDTKKTFNPNTRVLLVQHSRVKEFVEEYSSLVMQSQFALIIDELDTFTNPDSIQYKYVRFLSSKALICWGMTATPVHNRLENTYHCVGCVFPKNPFGSIHQFKDKYFEFQSIHMARAGRNLVIPQLIRHINLDKLKKVIESISVSCPMDSNIQFKFLECTLTDDEMSLYNKRGREAFKADSPASQIHSLQVLADGMSGIEGFSSKEKFLIEVIDSLVERGNPFIIYVSYHETRDRLALLLKDRGITTYQITGSTTIPARSKILSKLDSGGPICILITNAGLRGANLQKCESTIVYNIPFSIDDLVQLLGRQSRIGSPYTKNYVFFMTALGTIDEYKAGYLKVNSELVQQVVTGSAILPDNKEVISRKDIVDMRRGLLWGRK